MNSLLTRALGFMLAGAAMSCSAAAAEFTDPKTGFSVTVPAGFALKSPRSDPNHDILIDVVSLSGQPPAAGGGEAICAAGFKRFPDGTVASQAELNAQPAIEKMANDIKAMLRSHDMELQLMRSIPSKDFAGIEVVSKPMRGPDHENVAIYMATMDRVVGRTNIVCVTRDDALIEAMSVFQVIRDGARPPSG
ncbi:hypothetical protein [Antarcticirhabdus aurantiaca]|uniref:hypothetical protein n=1 Tax=Antarcticirhabdus aurantiaca TaxID=2606717 RepID=UPI001AEE53FE|nr:hypothetical protein [Antarcticirhabdus aurantiaca]